MNREDEEGAVSVMVRLANEPGTIFWISEHEESTSSSAQKRFELEKKLSKSIMKQLFEHGADIPGQQSLSIGEVIYFRVHVSVNYSLTLKLIFLFNSWWLSTLTALHCGSVEGLKTKSIATDMVPCGQYCLLTGASLAKFSPKM